MRRKLKCGTCDTTKNSAGGTLYAQGDSTFMVTMNPVGECYDCGEARRNAEEERKQKRLSRMMDSYTD